jgi:DNA-binding transcriptional LysR family regulator
MDFDMRAFVDVVDKGSFSAAAEGLGITPSAISKLVTRLEDRLGVRLLHRTTRRLALTAEGETYHLRARDILAAIEDAEAEVSRGGQTPRGRLRVNCVTGFALHELARALPDFIARYPEIHIELATGDRVIDLLAENTDVGIRSGPIVDPSLVVRKIADYERGLYASPEYLGSKGNPATPEELSNHSCIVQAAKLPVRWPFFVQGQRKEIQVVSHLLVDNAEAALRLALASGGIARVADTLVGDAVRNRRLIPVLTEFHAHEPIQLSAVYPSGRHRMPKVRAFLDFLIERFAKEPWRQGIPRRGAVEFARSSTGSQSRKQKRRSRNV